MSSAHAADAALAQRAALLADALAGLAARPRTLPCKWLYDAEGARLFEVIMRLPEYYPTRTEVAILRDRAMEVAAIVGPGAVVVEFGSGSADKVDPLLRALPDPAAYVPVDIAPEWLAGAVRRFARDWPGLPVRPVVADFTRPFALPPRLPPGPRLGFFPGSTIGNFAPEEAVAFLRRAREVLGAEGWLLLGADLVKDRAVLEAAYDDAAGVTAAFDLNLLVRLNRECGADFDLDGWAHRAVWNAAAERIEMHLVARRDQSVRIAGRRFDIAAGETIHTESSHKYRPERLITLADAAGFDVAAWWTDPARLFSTWLLQAR